MRKDKLRKFYSILRPIYVPISKSLSDKNYYTYRERRLQTSGTKYPDKTFYVVRRMNTKTTGLFSNYVYVLRGVHYAISKGYIPVVDFMNYPNAYLEEDEVGKINSWEYYFEQPCGYTLEDIKGAKNVILGHGAFVNVKNPPINMPEFFDSQEKIDYWRRFAKKYCRVKPNIQKIIKTEKEKLIGENRDVLGVHCRGTGYHNPSFGGLMKQPDICDVIKNVECFCNQNSSSRILFFSEEQTLKDSMKRYFGDRIIMRESVVYDYVPEADKMIPKDSKITKFEDGLQYLIDMSILARCKYLIMGPTFGAVGVFIMSEGFDKAIVYNAGKKGE
ncbi:MAG: hypothetical protein K6F52_06455 [Clostridia bacterium]|nr:hypothetical protein [Clostridia bacterium]